MCCGGLGVDCVTVQSQFRLLNIHACVCCVEPGVDCVKVQSQFHLLNIHMCGADCIKVQSQFHLLNVQGKPPSSADPLVMCKPLSHPSFAAGQLTIRPLEVKPNQYVQNDTLVCPLFTYSFTYLLPSVFQHCWLGLIGRVSGL